MQLNTEDFKVDQPATTVDLKYEKKGKKSLKRYKNGSRPQQMSRKQVEDILMETEI